MRRRKEESSSVDPTALKGTGWKSNYSYTKNCPVRKTPGVFGTGKETDTFLVRQAGENLCCASIISLSHFLSHFLPHFPSYGPSMADPSMYTQQGGLQTDSRH